MSSVVDTFVQILVSLAKEDMVLWFPSLSYVIYEDEEKNGSEAELFTVNFIVNLLYTRVILYIML